MTKQKKTKKEEVVEGQPLPLSREWFRQQGKRGGKIGGMAGGKASAAALSSEERSEKARRAVQVRWERYKKQKQKKETK